MSAGYRFDVGCPQCGSELEHQASGKVVAMVRTSAVARCPGCCRTWQVTVILQAANVGGSTSSERRRHYSRPAKMAAP